MPMIDHTVVLEVTGKQLLEVLENGVCMWPKLEGRFPQASRTACDLSLLCRSGV